VGQQPGDAVGRLVSVGNDVRDRLVLCGGTDKRNEIPGSKRLVGDDENWACEAWADKFDRGSGEPARGLYLSSCV
jgi:hypothetical protein